MTRLALALLLALAGPALAQQAPPPPPVAPPREGWSPLDDEDRRARPSFRERLTRTQRLLTRAFLPQVSGLTPPTTGRFRLGVLLVHFTDVGPAPWRPADFERALFSRGVYDRTPSGDAAFGSMTDYYDENSGGRLRLEGRVFESVRVDLARADLETALLVDPRGRRLFTSAIDALLARDGAGALEGLDALAFVIAGPIANRRGSVLWPHSTALTHRGRAWRYYLMHAEQGRGRFEAIGTHCHEFGHVLGLLDKYGVGRGTGLGQWCAMANGAHGGRAHGIDAAAPARGFCETAQGLVEEQVETAREWLKDLGVRIVCPAFASFTRRPARRLDERVRRMVGGGAPRSARYGGTPSPSRAPASVGEARPLHLCAVCKARLGWVRPAVIDPRRGARRIYLSPIEGDARQVARVLLDRAGREALILEARRPTGFDADLPRGGLLVWRTGDPSAMLRTFVPFESVELLAAHGVRSTDAALRDPATIPFPLEGRTELVVGGRGPDALRVRLSGIAQDEAGRLYVEVDVAR